jgi:hypothetical protein
MDRQCGSCAYAKRFRVAPDGSGTLDRVKCRSHDHAKWLDMQHITPAFSYEMERQGYVNLWRLEKVARRDYECPHWRPRETQTAVESKRRG